MNRLVYDGSVHRRRYLPGLCACALVSLSVTGIAAAGIEDWQVNEVVTSVGGSTAVRYVELFNQPGGCLFSSTRVMVFGADGALLGATTLVPSTTCFGPDSYFVITTPAGAAALGMSADHQGLPALPTDAGQVCFSATSTRYDCTRWGVIEQAVTDLFGSQDDTSAVAPGDGQALARVATTHMVLDDWELAALTPGQVNDGPPWTLPDAGPTPGDAGMPMNDAGTAMSDAGALMDDAGVTPVDAAVPRADAAPRPDARNTRYLDLDPAGGAGCGCGSSRARGAGPGAWLLCLAGLLVVRRRLAGALRTCR